MSTRHSMKIRQLKLKRLAICLCEIKKIKRKDKINILRSFGYKVRDKISTKEIDTRIEKMIPVIDNEYNTFRKRQNKANQRKRLRQHHRSN